MKTFRVLLIALAVAFCMVSCSPKDESGGGSQAKETPAPAVKEVKAQRPEVLIKTSMGDIKVELRPDLTPITVENFLRYVDEGFYDGKIFHRVISGFMIQGGGFDDQMKLAPTHAPIKNEAPQGLENLAGTISMARTNVIDSATAQFFINVKDNHFLNHVPGKPKRFGYAAFGRVVQGMDIAYKIAEVETGFRDVPKTPVVIESVTRVVDPE